MALEWLLVSLASLSASTAGSTDFGIRTVSDAGSVVRSADTYKQFQHQQSFELSEVVKLAGRWGHVTSTRRTAARNRAVGGAPNSFHLSGRAVDIARRAGVRHSHIEAAFKKAGFTIVESLDEGDHSHFAFRTEPLQSQPIFKSQPVFKRSEEPWRIVSAPGFASD